MIWIDIVCVVCLVVLILIGFWRGLLKSIFRLAAWISAIAGAYFAQNLLSETVANNFEMSGFTVKLVCVCIGFLIPFLIFQFIGHMTNKAVSGTAISRANRILGALLGIVKAYVLCFIFLSVLHVLPVSGGLKDARNASVSYTIYKSNLETFGFSSEEIDLMGVAEKKASEFSREITDKAVEKAKNVAAETAQSAIDSLKAKTDKTINARKDSILNKVMP